MNNLRQLFLIFLAILMMIHNSCGYMIRSQGYQIVEGVKNSIHQVIAYRFYLSFDIPLAKQVDYLELSFPVILNKQNTSYPLYRIIYALSIGDYVYSESELSFASNYPSIFYPCAAGSNSTLVFFQLMQDISKTDLYIMEIIPEPNIEFSEGIYSLKTVTMKAVSNNHLTNRLVYAHSSDIAMLKFKDNFITGDYAILEQGNSTTYLVTIPQSLNPFPQIVQNGGIIYIQIVSSNPQREAAKISSCNIQDCKILESNRSVMISFIDVDARTLSGRIDLNLTSQCMEVSFEITLLSSAQATQASSFTLPDSAFAFKKQSFSCMDYLIFSSMKYHWGLDKDAQNEVAVFVSSPFKQVYNTISITFSSNIEQVLSKTTYYFRIEIDLGQKQNSYLLLKTSCATTLPQLDTEHPVLCKQTSNPQTNLNVIQFNNIKELAQNALYTVSFRVIVFDDSSSGFRLNSINLLYCLNEDCSMIASTSDPSFPVIPSFINNYDTSKRITSYSWATYLGDIQIISVADTASETPDLLISKAFTSTSLNQGGGIFVNRGVESLVFFLSIDPAMLYSNQNKILKMTMLANNKFLDFSSSDTAGIRLAAQDKVTSSYSFSAQACSQGTTPGCYDGSTSEIKFGATSWVMNGKTLNLDTSTARYTLRCGIPGQPLGQPTVNCSKMFQGKETILNMYETGYGGVFVIPKVGIQSTFLPSKLSAASEKSLDFMVTFSLEDPLNLSDINQTILLSTMINGYALSYDPSTEASFLGSFVNLSKDNLNRFTPSFFRLIVTNPLPNQFIFIFLDDGVELTSFSDETALNYSCQVLHQSVQSTYDKNRCIAFQHDNLYYSKSLSSTNFLMNNLVVISTTTCVSCNSLEIIIPITPSTNTINSVTMHVGYGELAPGKTFPCGASCFEIRKLISLFGVSSSGPSLQTQLNPFIDAFSLFPENLTGDTKLQGYNSIGKIQFHGNIEGSTTSASFTDEINNLNYSEISSDGSYTGAGIILASIGSDLFIAKFNIRNVAGGCSKFSYYSANSKFSPRYSSLTLPLNPYDSLVRFAVFCPMNASNIPYPIEILTSSTNSKTQSSNLSFFLSYYPQFNSPSSEDNRLFLSVSEKYGRNLAQQPLSYSLDSEIMAPTVQAQIIKNLYSYYYFKSLTYSFLLEFRFPFFIKQKLLIDIQIPNDYLQGNYAVNEVSVVMTDDFIFSQIEYSVSLYHISIVLSATDYLQIPPVSFLIISFFLTPTTTTYSTFYNLQFFKFNLSLQGGETASLGGPQQSLFFQYSPSFDDNQLTFINDLNWVPKIQVIIEDLYFKKLMPGARDRLRMNFTIISSEKEQYYNPKTEKFHLNLGFLRNAKYSQDTCFFYTDETYTERAHIVSEFNDYTFSFKKSFSLWYAKFHLECQGVAFLDESILEVPVTLTYYDINNGMDQITELVKTNVSQMTTPELLYSSNILLKKLNIFTIQRVELEYQDCGMNGLIIYFHIDYTSFPFSVFLEMIVYLPRAFDLRSDIYSASLDCTIIYLPREHALRFKISSDKLIEQTLQFAPIFITQQVIQEAIGQYIYIELINPFNNNDFNSISSSNLFSSSNKIIDYAYYKIPETLFVNVQEQFPDEITNITIAVTVTTPLGFPLNPFSYHITDFSISFSMPQLSLAGIDSILIVTYIGTGDQIKIDRRLKEIKNQQNGYMVSSFVTDANLKIITVDLKSIITSYNVNRLFSPIRIQVYTEFDSLLLAVVYNTIVNTFSEPSFQSNNLDNPEYNCYQLLYLTDSEGDQIYSLPLFQELIDKSAQWKLGELNMFYCSFFQWSLFTLDEYYKYFWTSNSQFHFSFAPTFGLAFKKSFLTNQWNNTLSFCHNRKQTGTVSIVPENPLLNVFLNEDSKCNVAAEQKKYYIQNSGVGIVRFILDDYCQFHERLQMDWLIPHMPSEFGNITFIQPQFYPEKDTNNVIFYVIIHNNVTEGSQFQITYTSQFAQLNILSTTIQVESQATPDILQLYWPYVTLQPLTYEQSKEISSTTKLSFRCNSTSVIFYEMNIQQRTNQFLDSSALITFLRNGQIKQYSHSQTQLSNHIFGSFICQAPSKIISPVQEFLIENLIIYRQSILRLILPDGTVSNYPIFTGSQRDAVLYHIQLYLVFIPPSNKAMESVIFDFYLCLLSDVLIIPHSRLKFLTRPYASCQNYLENSPFDFSKPMVVNTDDFCQKVTEQLLQSGYSYEAVQTDSNMYDKTKRDEPIQFSQDFSIFVELQSQNLDQPTSNLDFKKIGFPYIKTEMNKYVITEYFHFCSRANVFAMISGQNTDISATPKVQLIRSAYDTNTLISSLYFKQIFSISILYIALTFREWTKQESASINARSFLEDQMKTDLSVFNRFIYPLDFGETARFNFTLPGNQTQYWVYYFLTDMTVQEFVYSYPVEGAVFEKNSFTLLSQLNNSTSPSNNSTSPSNNSTSPSNNSTSPSNNNTSPSNSGSTPSNNVVDPLQKGSSSLNIVMILMVALPIGGLSILGIVCFYVRYRRKLRNSVKPHKDELNGENVNRIVASEAMGSNGEQFQGKDEGSAGELPGQSIAILSGNKRLSQQPESKNAQEMLNHNQLHGDNTIVQTDKGTHILPNKLQIIPQKNVVSSEQVEEIPEQDGIIELRTDNKNPFDQNQFKRGESKSNPLEYLMVQQQSSNDIMGNNRTPDITDQDRLKENQKNKQENNNFLEENRDQGKQGKSIQVTKNTVKQELEEQSSLDDQYADQEQEEIKKNNRKNEINQGRVQEKKGIQQINNLFEGQDSKNSNEDQNDESGDDQDEEKNSWLPRKNKQNMGEQNPSLQQQHVGEKMPLKKNNLFDFNNEIDGEQKPNIAQQPDNKFGRQQQGRQQQLRKNQGSIEVSQTSNNLLEVDESDDLNNQEPQIGLQRGGQQKNQGHKGVVTIEQISNGLLEVEDDQMETQEYIGIQRENNMNQKQQGQGRNKGKQDQERKQELGLESELDLGEETGRGEAQEFGKKNQGNNKNGREPSYQRGYTNQVLEIDSEINMDDQSYQGKKPQANKDFGIQGKRARGKGNQGLQQQFSNDLLELESDFNIGDSNQLLRQSGIDQQDIQRNTNRPSKGNEVGKRRYSNGLLELESDLDFEETRQSGAQGRGNPFQKNKGQSGNGEFSNGLLELESNMNLGEPRQSEAKGRGNPIQMNKGQPEKQQFSNGLLELESDMDFGEARQSEAQGKNPFRRNKGETGTGQFSNGLLELESDMNFGETKQPGSQGRGNPIQMNKGQPRKQQFSNGLLELESDMNLGEEVGLQQVMPSKINSKPQGNEHLKNKGTAQPRLFSNTQLELESDMDFGEAKRSGVQPKLNPTKLNQGQSGTRKFSNGLLELENDMNFGDSIGQQQIQQIKNEYGAQGNQYQNDLKKDYQRRFSNGLLELESDMIFGEGIGLNQIMPSQNQNQYEGNRNPRNKEQDGMKQFSNGLLELESDMNYGEYPTNQQISQKNYADQKQLNKLKQGQTKPGFQQNNSIEGDADIEEQVGRKQPFSQKTAMNVQKQQKNQGRNDDSIEEYEGLQRGSKGQQENQAADNSKIKQGQLKVNQLSQKQEDDNINLDIIQQGKKQKAEQTTTNQKKSEKSNQRQRKLFNDANADDIEEYKAAIKNQISSSKQPETTNSKSTKQGKLIKTDKISKGKNKDQDLEEYSNSKRQGQISEKKKVEDQNIKDERLKKLQMAREDIIDDYDIQDYNGGNQLLQIEDNNSDLPGKDGKVVFNGRKEKMTVTFYNKQQKDQHHDDLEEINL